MKGLILAAGYGTRLGKLTKQMPKPMIKIAGKPVLEHIADHMNKYGIYEIIVNTHYMPGKIMDHFGTRFLYSYEPDLLGEEGTIASLSPYLSNNYVVVMNGDTLTNIDLEKMYKMSKGNNVKFYDKDTYAGTRIIQPNYGLERQNDSFKYYDPRAWWIDIGTPEGLERAREFYAQKPN